MRMRRDLIFILTVAAISTGGRAHEIQRLDPSLYQLVAPDSKLERIATGFNKWTEGPVANASPSLVYAQQCGPLVKWEESAVELLWP